MELLISSVPKMPEGFAAWIGFIAAPIDEVADSLMAWKTELQFEPVRTNFRGGLAECAQHLLPLDPIVPMRGLLVGTDSRWTAYFSSHSRGGDPGPPMHVLAKRLKTETVIVDAKPFQVEPDAIPNSLGGLQFWYDDYAQSEPRYRAISLIEGESSSSTYHFETWGDPLPWEDLGKYELRYKRHRFTREMLASYCGQFDIRPFELDFYRGPSVMVERTVGLKEWRKRESLK